MHMQGMQSSSANPTRGIALDSISKRFGPVMAVDQVSVTFERGEIHALLGENGAGKSTLMNILFGTLNADGGLISIDGKAVAMSRWTTQKAITAGIGMIHQHFSLVNEHSVLENIVMPTLAWRALGMDWREHRRRLDGTAEEFGLTVQANALVADLAVGERQQVEILKMLYQGADVLILDEPTSVLTPQQIEVLFRMLLGFRERGHAVIIITHKLEDAMRLCDRITVLRQGRRIDTVRPDEVTVTEVAHMMVARKIERVVRQTQPEVAASVVLQAQDVVVPAQHAPSVDGISLSVRAGEILGIAGVAGNGQSVLVEALLGLRPVSSGRIWLNGVEVTHCDVSERRSNGLSFVAEDRHAMGMVADMDVTANMLLQRIDQKPFCRGFILDRHMMEEHARKAIREFDIRVHSPQTLMGTLSGGNQQKVVLSRELSSAPRVLIVSEPSRGLDFASAAYVRECLLERTSVGLGVLLVSSDLDELFSLSHRIVVMYQGRIIGDLDADAYDSETIGLMMAGVQTCNRHEKMAASSMHSTGLPAV